MSTIIERESRKSSSSFQREIEVIDRNRATPPPGEGCVTPKYFRWKSPFIRLIAAAMLLIALPFIAIAVFFIRRNSPGPAIYRQVRVGRYGVPFVMYKLRTMVRDAEAVSGPVWCKSGDPRVTRIGYWLRELHLDEFPQLLNVVLGQMDLFGPRPERPEFVRRLRRDIPGYERRLDVLPGITGLAQMTLPPDESDVTVRRKLRMDVEYIQRGCLSLDLRLFFCTLLRLMAVGERHACAISGVRRIAAPVLAELNGEVALAGEVDHEPASNLDSFAGCDPDGAGEVENGSSNKSSGQSTKCNNDEVSIRTMTMTMTMIVRNGNGSRFDKRQPMLGLYKTDVLNALTIDVEDYFQVSGFEKSIDRDSWPTYESRVVRNTQRMLRILKRHNIKATFFVLGWVAENFPDIVREIQDDGHEIGSHSYWHRLVYDMTPCQFREDLCRSRDVLEEITGEQITLFRAPSFSITDQSTWALDILVQEGFTVDSSIFPVRHHRYGMSDAPTQIHEIHEKSGVITECPPSVVRMFGTNVPVAGGGYFRLYPSEVTCSAIRHVNGLGQPFIFYAHPWEVDPDQPRQENAGTRLSRFRHYVNLGVVERRMEMLVELFRFGRLSDSIAWQYDTRPLGGPDSAADAAARPR